MISFIFGDAGSGKTQYICKWLSREAEAHPEGKYYLFVPEQNTLSAQRDMIRCSSRHGMLNADVLSFQLLSYRVMEELGMEKPVIIDEVSRSILLRKAALEAAPELKLYRQKINAQGFIDQLGRIISEFCQYDTDMDSLKAAGEASGLPMLKEKIDDICLIYKIFREKLEAKAAIPEDIAHVLLSVIGRSGLLDGAVIVFDGYTGFTPIQLKIIEHIISRASLVRFSVTMPPEADPYRRYRAGSGEISDMFWLSRETVAAVCTSAERNNIARGADESIAREGKPADVSMITAENPSEEVRLAARDIRRNALLNGVRYKKMSIVVSDLSVYKELIRAELEKEEIPFFMDDRTDALGSPAVEYVRCVLTAIGSNYRYDELMAFLRVPLVTPDEETREKADLLDNFLRKTGLRGRRALTAAALPIDPAAVIGLEEALKKADSIALMTEAVRTFCRETGLEERAALYADRLEKAGLTGQAGECRRFMTLIPGLFDRISAVLGEESCSADEFARLIDAGFRGMKGGLIPETMDMVMIGDLKRSRFSDIERLYVLGANEGLMPPAVSGGGIFTDRERNEIQRSDIALAPDDRTDSCISRFYLRMVLNKPSGQLIVMNSAAGRDGRPLRPSGVIGELKAGVYGSFGTVENVAGDASALIGSPADGLMIFAAGAGTDAKRRPGHEDLYRALVRNGYGEETGRILDAAGLSHGRDRLSKQAADALYKGVLEGSVTRLESYEGCPFSHFAKYGLGLRERETHEIEASDLGILFHSVLDRVFAELKRNGREITELSEAELDALCLAAADTVTAQYNDSILESSARNRYISEKVRRTALRTLRVLRKQLGEGDFRTEGTELKFSRKTGSMILHGVIDRLDVCEEEGTAYVRVVDYKSGNREFSLSRVLGGLDLQLVTYMDNALRMRRAAGSAVAVPSGMFYYHIDDPFISYSVGLDAKGAEAGKLSELRLKGAVSGNARAARHNDRELGSAESGEEQISGKAFKGSSVISEKSEILSEEEFRGLMELTAARMRRDAEKILEGDIDIRPARNGDWKKCDHCPFRAVCRFDTGISGFRYRTVTKPDRTKIAEMLTAAGREGQADK